jgi:ATP synthase I subunit
MSATTPNEHSLLALLSKGSWALLGIMSVGALLFGSVPFAASILAGGLLAMVNFYWLHSILRRVLQLQPSHSDRYVQLRYLLRLTLLAAILYGLLVAGTNVYGLLLGLSVLVINIIVIAIYYTLTLKGG